MATQVGVQLETTELFNIVLSGDKTDPESIGINSRLYAIKEIGAIWDYYHYDRKVAMQAILYAWYVSDISGYNPYRGLQKQDREVEAAESLFGGDSIPKGSQKIQDAILVLEELFELLPEYTAVQAALSHAEKGRNYLVSFDSTDVDPAVMKDFLSLASLQQKAETIYQEHVDTLTRRLTKTFTNNAGTGEFSFN